MSSAFDSEQTSLNLRPEAGPSTTTSENVDEMESKARSSLPDFKMKEKTVEEICKLGFKGGLEDVKRTKMSIEAVKLTSEVIKIYIVEALKRAGEQAKREAASEVTLEHLEKTLPQFLLDFN